MGGCPTSDARTDDCCFTVTLKSLDRAGVDRDLSLRRRGLRRLEDELAPDRNELLRDRDRPDIDVHVAAT